MNCENASKEIVQWFIDLMNMAKGLMDENQQPSITQELRRTCAFEANMSKKPCAKLYYRKRSEH